MPFFFQSYTCIFIICCPISCLLPDTQTFLRPPPTYVLKTHHDLLKGKPLSCFTVMFGISSLLIHLKIQNIHYVTSQTKKWNGRTIFAALFAMIAPAVIGIIVCHEEAFSARLTLSDRWAWFASLIQKLSCTNTHKGRETRVMRHECGRITLTLLLYRRNDYSVAFSAD